MIAIVNRFRQMQLLQLFTIYLRYLIGSAFIIAAIVMGKLSSTPLFLSGEAASPIGDLLPMQQFFRVMQESGLYWNFIGWSQIAAGVLLITQRQAKIGALIFFGMILNIFVITVSYHFSGTPIVTGLMLLASLYLIVWDLQSFRVLVTNAGDVPSPPLPLQDASFWVWLGWLIIITEVVMAFLHVSFFLLLLIPFLEGLLGLIVFMIFRKKLSTQQ